MHSDLYNYLLPNPDKNDEADTDTRVLSGDGIQKSRSSGIVMLAGMYGILDKNWLGIT